MVAANTVSAALVPVEYCAIARASKPETMLYNSESIESTSELDRMAGDALAVEHRSGGGGSRGVARRATSAHSSLFLTTTFVRSESDDVEEGAVVALIDDDDNKAFEASFVSDAGVEVAGLGRPWCDGLLVAW